MTGLVSTVVEAWQELRIHRLRVLLALVGVAVAVTAITGVTAAVAMLKQAFAEQTDRQSGRQVTLMVSAWSMTGATTEEDNARVDAAYAETLARYGLTWSTRDLWTGAPIRFPGSGVQDIGVRAVDPAAGVLQRIPITEGRWFTAADAQAYAPTLVVNEAFLDRVGARVADHPTVLLGRTDPVRATVIGVMDEGYENPEPFAMVLYDQLAHWYGTANPAWGGGPPTLSVWVPADMADELGARISRDMAAAVPGLQVDVSDNRGWGETFDIDGAARWVGIGVGAFALLLGGLGLVNIALVTVRYRIREIGIRRSFGATSGRVFFGVLMESVVATVVAGAVGVVLAVAIIKSVPVDRVFGGAIQEMPPFPVSAALVGMAAATGVGALAGLIPAVVAVRVKVIDAIRY